MYYYSRGSSRSGQPINTTKYEYSVHQKIQKAIEDVKASMMEFFRWKLYEKQPRTDYQELLQLTMFFFYPAPLVAFPTVFLEVPVMLDGWSKSFMLLKFIYFQSTSFGKKIKWCTQKNLYFSHADVRGLHRYLPLKLPTTTSILCVN